MSRITSSLARGQTAAQLLRELWQDVLRKNANSGAKVVAQTVGGGGGGKSVHWADTGVIERSDDR